MKRPIYLAIGIATAAIVTPSFADNTDNKAVSVSGKIVQSLQIGATDMAMPNIVRPGTSPTGSAELSSQVTLACHATDDGQNTVTYTRNGNPFAAGNATATSSPSLTSSNRGISVSDATGTCASLTVGGEPNYYFFLKLGAITNTDGPSALVTAVTCKDENDQNVDTTGVVTNAIGATGSLTVRCGATTTITSAAPSTYSATFTATVTYD